MFVRRLLLLSGLALVSAAPLVVQLGRLTLVKGEGLRIDAQSRLIRRQWTPTVRGSIVDRKGRVLAQDRPSYDIQVSFDVVNGEWARGQAAIAARRMHGQTGWLGLTSSERSQSVQAWLSAYQVHLEKGWDALAGTLGISRAELDSRRDGIVARVNQSQEALTKRRIESELAQARERGEEVTSALMRAIERRAAAPIAEFRAHHTIASRVSDELAFAAGNLEADEVSIEISQVAGVAVGQWLGATEGRMVARLPGLRTVDSGDRDYPYERMEVSVDRRTLPTPVRVEDEVTISLEGVACHILGRMRDKVFGDAVGGGGGGGGGLVVAGDATRRREYLAANPAAAREAFTTEGVDRGFYRDGDRVGETGIEGAQEQLLRGLRGSATAHLDTGIKDYVKPVAGGNIALTLDIMLQGRVQAAMSEGVGLAVVLPWHHQESETQPVGTKLYGAAVVLDIDTGEVLAAVSTPTFTRQDIAENPDSVFKDELLTPYVNRCWQRPYPPGSITKAAVLAGAITFGNLRPEETIACNGYLIPDRPDIYRCLIYKRYHTTHSILLDHDLEGTEALMVSCNIFFYTMGRRMGTDTLVKLYQAFGLGSGFDLGAGGEFAGPLGKQYDGSPLTPPDAIQMAIGQGPVSWTPLHAADMYATLARRGVRIAPTLIKDVGARRGPAPAPTELGLDPRGVAMAVKGLELAVNGERGTGRTLTFDGIQEPIFNASGVKVWGKTGTATAPDLRARNLEGTGPGELLEKGDHSWFVVFAGRDRPKYAIAVVIDYGGSGGKVSGPIANQIIHALIAEGYLQSE